MLLQNHKNRTKHFILLLLFCSFLFTASGCGVVKYLGYVLLGNEEQKAKAEYAGLNDKKVLILLNTPDGMEYSYPQSRESLIIACQQILKANIETISFCDYQMVEDFILRELDWISVPTSTLAKKFGADRVLYIDIYDFTLQDTDSIGIYQGQVNAEVKIYETDSKAEAPNRSLYSFYIDLKYPENHPLAATPEAKYRVLSGTIKLTAYEICKHFFDHTEKEEE